MSAMGTFRRIFVKRLRNRQQRLELKREQSKILLIRKESKERHEQFIKNIGVQKGIANNLIEIVLNKGIPIGNTYASNKANAYTNLEADDRAKEDADYDTTTDDKPDVSNFGYGKQVSKFALQQGRDFTYTMEMIRTSKDAPSQDGRQRKTQKQKLLMEWGETIKIYKAKGNSYEECLEIYTIIFLAKAMYSLERKWKKAIIKYLPHLENLSYQSSQQTAIGDTQLGLIIQSNEGDDTSLEDMTNALRQAEMGRDDVVRRNQNLRRGMLRERDINERRNEMIRVAGGKRLVGERERGELEQMGKEDPQTYRSNREGGGVGESKGEDRRRLGGMNQQVNYTRTPNKTYQTKDGTYMTTAIEGGGEGASRLPQGVQSVRHIHAQRARPPPKVNKRDNRPKMNVAETQFKMRKSRINPNLLFVNLQKQNPNRTQDLPSFKTRPLNIKLNRINF